MSRCAVVVSLPPLMIAKIVSSFNISLHSSCFVQLSSLCHIHINPIAMVIHSSKVEECINRTKLCSLCPQLDCLSHICFWQSKSSVIVIRTKGADRRQRMDPFFATRA